MLESEDVVVAIIGFVAAAVLIVVLAVSALLRDHEAKMSAALARLEIRLLSSQVDGEGSP